MDMGAHQQPIPIITMIIADPPWETSGSGTPPMGMEPVTIAILKATFGVEVRILDPQGAELLRGEVGEMVLSPAAMLGYWNKPDETARAPQWPEDAAALWRGVCVAAGHRPPRNTARPIRAGCQPR